MTIKSSLIENNGCKATHTAIIVEGTIHNVSDDGSETTRRFEATCVIASGYDVKAVVDKPSVMYGFRWMWDE